MKYLKNDLEWPIETEDFEELTYDYDPEELGIDPKNAVKIEEIQQLRPLMTNQPWGIFFVKFGKNRLSVVALRRILSQLVIKKRATMRKADQPSWHLHDLLFISNFCEDNERKITFARFTQNEETGDLPTLKVLGWDEGDTALHMDHVQRELKDKLCWPKDERDANTWRDQWSSAFTIRHREVITTSEELAVRLADLAKKIRNRTLQVLAIESDTGQLRKLHKAFREALIHDLSEDDFADMYAQTIAYGLLAARVSRPMGITADNMADMVPITNPFLKEMLIVFLTVGGRKSGIDFDELGVQDIVTLLNSPDTHMEDVLRDFGNKTRQEDPVIHFYELFLKEYDRQKKVERGVFYTPQPIVSYIVRSVHELLQTEFGLEDGLASTITWGEMIKKNPDLKLPILKPKDPDDKESENITIPPDKPFVTILDPATGTATFLVEVIDIIHKKMTAKWEGQGMKPQQISQKWNEYIPQHLLPRLYGFELMMAPYAIAHMKIGLKLHETGYKFGSDERVRVYLTNSLEPAIDSVQRDLVHYSEAIAHEATAVNEVKRNIRFSIIIGNPPYSMVSFNFNPFINTLMDDYKKHVRGEQGLVALSDDYLKFLRLSQAFLHSSGCGLWGMITNHGYLKGIVHRGVRIELINQFDLFFILDLHGDSNIGEIVPAGKSNENVFDIQQGVSISIGISGVSDKCNSIINYSEVWGTRQEKYDNILNSLILNQKWSSLYPTEPNYFLIPFDCANLDEYNTFPSINALMPINSCGVKTHRDSLIIDFDKKNLISRMEDIASEQPLDILRKIYEIKDTPNWKLKDARTKIRSIDIRKCILQLTYRPFDQRWIYYNPAIIEKGDSKFPTLRHMFQKNVALLTARIQATGVFNAVFVSQNLVEMKTAESSRSSTIFPLFLNAERDTYGRDGIESSRKINLNLAILHSWANKLSLKIKNNGLPHGITPEEIFYYTYSILHSPSYRTRYSEFLKIDFPRVPLPNSLDLFKELAPLGCDLVALHLLESLKLNKTITKFIGTIPSSEIEKVTYLDNTVWINKDQTEGFRGVPENVWNFRIGGYQVCEKWLKSRKGRQLSTDDITHYQKIVMALNETIRIMGEIDAVIDKHGGWPGAFDTSGVGVDAGTGNPTQSGLFEFDAKKDDVIQL